MKKALNEGSSEFKKIKKEWMTKTKNMTIDKLPGFLKELTEKYGHDYGTICHAAAIAAQAACWAVNHSNQGGITGFQAGAVMWEFIKGWMYSSNKTGLRLIDYDKLLYPQYLDQFKGTSISASVWGNVQKEAAREIKKYEVGYEKYLADIPEYEKALDDFKKRHPGYKHLPQYYEEPEMATWAEHENCRRRKAIGYEFAPRKPHAPYVSPHVLQHWRLIVEGKSAVLGVKISKN